MDATGTTDEVNPTDATDTTDASVEGPPVTRPQPGVIIRSYDVFAGVACIGCGCYLIARGFGFINYPEVQTWLSP